MEWFQKRIVFMTKIFSLLVFTLNVKAYGVEPQFSISFKDTSKAYQFINENSWFKNLYNSNLFQGLMLRTNISLKALGTEEQNSWKGTLLNYVYENVLKNRMMQFSYFHVKKLSSPFGVFVNDIGETESAILKKLIAEFDNGNVQELFQSEKVSSISIKGQLYAVILDQNCLSIARDPNIAAWMIQKCRVSKTLEKDMKIQISFNVLAPSIYPFMEKFTGMGNELNFDFEYDEKSKRFVPDTGKITLSEKHIFKSMSLSDQDLMMIPKDSLFFVNIWLPRPAKLSSKEVSNYLKKDKDDLRKLEYFPVSLIHLGMKHDFSSWVPMTAVVFKYPNMNEKEMVSFDTLIGFNQYASAHYRKICNDYYAISDSEDTILQLEKACRKEIVSVAFLSDSKKKALINSKNALNFYVNIADFAKNILRFAWNNSESFPPEMEETEKILGEIPSYTAKGTVDGELLELKGSL